MAKRGATATGLDIASSAIKAAEEYRDGAQLGEVASRALYRCEDFFTTEAPQGGYDVVYDYTFLCALPPELREDWAKTMARIVRPGGELITLIFPVGKDPKAGGPPFGVTPDIYRELLTPQGFEEVSLNKVPESLSHRDRENKEFLGRWKR